MKKIIVVALSVVFLVGVFAVVAPVQAASLSEVQKQLQSLLGQVKQMQAQNQSAAVIDAVSSDETMETSAPTTTNWCFTFKNNLRRGDAGRQVSNLQTALEKEGFTVRKLEKQSNEFGDSTKSAAIGFQEKYKNEILAPINETQGTGLVGNTTRAKINQLYGCGAMSAKKGIIVSSPQPNQIVSSPLVVTGYFGSSACYFHHTVGSPVKIVDAGNNILGKSVTEDVGECVKRGDVYILNFRSVINFNQPQTVGASGELVFEFESPVDGSITTGLKIPIKFSTTQTQQPVISNLSPSSGPIGTKVQLVGGFTQSNNIVQFGPVAIPNLFSIHSEGAGAEIMYFTVPQSGPSSCTIDGICTKNLVTIKPGIYSVRVKNANGESNSVNFEVTGATTTPSITVISPNGGEMWKAGETRQIIWSGSMQQMRLLYTKPDGSIDYTRGNISIASHYNVPDTSGVYSWQIPTYVPSGKYYLQIEGCCSEIGGGDNSDAPFSIVNSGTGSGLTQNQIDAIIALLKSFGANQSAIDSTRAVLEGK